MLLSFLKEFTALQKMESTSFSNYILHVSFMYVNLLLSMCITKDLAPSCYFWHWSHNNLWHKQFQAPAEKNGLNSVTYLNFSTAIGSCKVKFQMRDKKAGWGGTAKKEGCLAYLNKTNGLLWAYHRACLMWLAAPLSVDYGPLSVLLV